MMDMVTPMRRRRIDLQTEAEAAIRSAIDAVEAAGAHPHLTAAVILLDRARERVADLVDGVATPASSLHEQSCPCYPDCADETCQGCECGAAELEKLRADLAAAEATSKRIAQESEARLQRIGELEKEVAERIDNLRRALASTEGLQLDNAALRAANAYCAAALAEPAGAPSQPVTEDSHELRAALTEANRKNFELEDKCQWYDGRLLERLRELEGMENVVRELSKQRDDAFEVCARLGAERDQNAELAREWRERAESFEREAQGQRAKQAHLVKENSGDRVALAGFRASAEALAKFLAEFSGGEMDPSPAMAAASAITYIRHLSDELGAVVARPGNGAAPSERPLTDRTFYLVWCPQGPTPPSYRHPNEDAARREAARLARGNEGREFHVLRSTGKVVFGTVWIDHDIVDDEAIPF